MTTLPDYEKCYHSVKLEYEMIDFGRYRSQALELIAKERVKYNQALLAHSETAKALSKCRGEKGIYKLWKELTTAQATVIAAAVASPVLLKLLNTFFG